MGPLQFPKVLRQRGLVVEGVAPAEDSRQVIAGSKRENADLTLEFEEALVGSRICTLLWMLSLSQALSTHPTLPSPPHTKTRNESRSVKKFKLRGILGRKLFLTVRPDHRNQCQRPELG